MDHVRQRKTLPSNFFAPTWDDIVFLDEKKKNNRQLDGRVVFSVVAVFYVIITSFINIRLHSYPNPKTIVESSKHDFVEERARNHLNIITGFGPRIPGSKEISHAEDYIVRQLKEISDSSSQANVINVDVQRVSGSLALDFVGVGEFTNVYENVTNVIAKLSPRHPPARYSVLINCHYDSVADSPGASDSAVSCCLMLEILRVLSQSETSLTHNIIFLFNGAEENILQASHGFITKHPWAKSIGAFVNLDSAGAGGWEMVFQTGPEHPWLVRAYATSAIYPCASVLSQEIFQSGMIPSDTDYRVFRDFGHIAGLDIAHIQNGFVYHTQNDIADFIAPGCIQRGGENLMSLLTTLASSDQVVDPGSDRHGNMVFYDFIGLFMVYYTQRIAVIINWSTVVLMCILFSRKLSSGKGGFSKYTLRLMGAVVGVAVTWMVVLVCVLMVAVMMTMIGREMSWFTTVTNITWLYIIPGAAAALSFHLLLKHTVYKNCDMWQVEALYYEANVCMWSLILVVFTYTGIMSVYIALLWVICPVLVRTLLSKLLPPNPAAKPKTFLAINLAMVFIPAVYTAYISFTVFMVFMPIMGRMTAVMPDIPISVMSALPVMFCISYHAGLVYTSRRITHVVVAMVVISLVGIATIVITPLGFPFTADKSESSQQRAVFFHTDRRYHNIDKNFKNSSSIWYVPFDYHGIKSIEKYAPAVFKDAVPVQCEGTYCGRPYKLPVVSLFKPEDCVDVPAPPLNFSDRTSIKSVQREQLSDDTIRLTIQVTGPHHRSSYITPRLGVKLTRWSMANGRPKPSKTGPVIAEPTYFVYFAHGEGKPGVWDFFIEFHVDRQIPKSEPIVDIAFAGHYLHGNQKTTPAMLSFIEKLPPWTVSFSWTSTYDMYQF